MRKSNTPFSTKLPEKGAMKALNKSQRTINDYAKLSPIKSLEQLGPVVRMTRKPR